MKIHLEINDTYTIESRRGASVLVTMSEIDAAMLPMLFENGLNQKVRDTASSAAKLACVDKFGEEAVGTKLTDEQKKWLATSEGSEAAKSHELALMVSAVKTLKEGTWSQRGVGVTRDDRTAAIVNVFAAMLSSAEKKRFAKLSFREKLEAANANEIGEDLVNAEIERLVAMRDAKSARDAEIAKIGKKVKITF